MPNAPCSTCGAAHDEDEMYEVQAKVRRTDTDEVLHESETRLVCESCVAKMLVEQAGAGGEMTLIYDDE